MENRDHSGTVSVNIAIHYAKASLYQQYAGALTECMYICAFAELQSLCTLSMNSPLFGWRTNLEAGDQTPLLMKREVLQRAMTLMTNLQLNAQVYHAPTCTFPVYNGVIIYTARMLNTQLK